MHKTCTFPERKKPTPSGDWLWGRDAEGAVTMVVKTGHLTDGCKDQEGIEKSGSQNGNRSKQY